jgi:hypothetical protein
MSLSELFSWFARLGASSAAENAREAVEANARVERISVELEERAQLNGWARPAYSTPAVGAEESKSA